MDLIKLEKFLKGGSDEEDEEDASICDVPAEEPSLSFSSDSEDEEKSAPKLPPTEDIDSDSSSDFDLASGTSNLMEKLNELDDACGVKGRGRRRKQPTRKAAAAVASTSSSSVVTSTRGKRGRKVVPKAPPKTRGRNTRNTGLEDDPNFDPIADKDFSEHRLASGKTSKRKTRNGGGASGLWVHSLLARVERDGLTMPAAANRRGRKRRNQPDIVDLVSSPPLVLPGLVNLDSDEEIQLKSRQQIDPSEEDLNYEISIKLSWSNEIERHNVKKFQPFEDLMKKLAARESTEVASIILMIGDRVIKGSETPNSINYKITDIITGRVVEGLSTSALKKVKRDKNVIKIKLQTAIRKNPIEIEVDKSQNFFTVAYKCAEALGIDAQNLKLQFDGDAVNLEETPIDLEFEGGEILDCIVAP